MNKTRIASELLFLAKELVGIDFPTRDALDKYLKEHPKANRSNHRVVKIKNKGPKKEDRSSDFPKHKKVTPTARSLGRVKEVLKAHGLTDESDELQEMAGFKRTLGQRVPESKVGQWYVRNEAKLKKDFIANMNPANYDSREAFDAAKKRMNDMPTSDFGKILAAISDEDVED